MPLPIYSSLTMSTHAGDSRAVLCRSGVAIPLTDDHKAAREDETVSFDILGQNNKRTSFPSALAVDNMRGLHVLRFQRGAAAVAGA